MNWILSLIFMTLGLVFLFFGYKNKNVEITFVGYLFIFIVGVGVLSTGLAIPTGYLIG